jgi:hypothetical protein
MKALFASLGRATSPFRVRLDKVAYLAGVTSLMGITGQSQYPQANQTTGNTNLASSWLYCAQ